MRLMCVVAAILFLGAVCEAQQFLAVIPSELRNGMYFKVDVMLFQAPTSSASVNISITSDVKDVKALAWSDSMFTINFNTGQDYGSGQLTVPYDIYAGTSLYVHLTFGGGLSIKSQYTTVETHRPAPSLFVQTDKGIYKPGDTIKFCVLSTDMNLIPKNEKLQVIIKDAMDNAIMDKTADPATDTNFKPLVCGVMTLSKDPVLGTYKIIVQTDSGQVEASFDVAEYVLPKFDVQLEMTRSFAVRGPNARISGRIVSKYTYGEMVVGEMVLKLSGKVVKTVANFDGMATFDIAVKDLPPEIVTYDIYRPSNTMNLFVEVSEIHTENKANASKTFTLFNAEFKATVQEPTPFAFAGATVYTLEAELTDPMGNPLTDWDTERTGSNALQYYKLNYEIDGQRPVTVDITSNPQAFSVDVTNLERYTINMWYTYEKVNGERIDGIRSKVSPARYYTQSEQQLMVEEVPAVNQGERCFQITPYTAGDTAYYQISNNYYAEDVLRYTNADGHCFTPSREHAPVSVVVGYKAVDYIKDDGTAGKELITAFVVLEMPWTSAQSVSMELLDDKVEPGDDVTIAIQADPYAYVHLAGLDKSVTLLADSNDITAAKLQEAREQYRPFSRPGEKPGYVQNPPFFNFRGGPAPIAEMKKRSINRKKRCIACWEEHEYMDATKLLKDHVGLVVVTDLEVNRQTGDNVEKVDSDTEEEKEEEIEVRKDFPETWLWNMVQTNAAGAVELTEEIPDVITSWVLNAFAFSNTNGLGVAPPVEVVVFKDMFISMNLPYAVVRHEVFTLQIVVFNYMSTPADVDVELIDGVDFDIENMTDRVQSLEIGAGASGLAEVEIKASTIGEIKLGCSLTMAGSNVDFVERVLEVKPEGLPVTRSTNLQISVPPAHADNPFDLSKVFDPDEMLNFVEGSLRMYLKVTGDVMGPYIDNLEGNIRMPSGCGEQNIQSLTPSLFVAKYLKAIDRYEDAVEALVGKVCGYGYRKELRYKHPDGSYSAFGPGPSLCTCGGAGATMGSTWLTAYVLKTFSLLKNEQLTFVDPAVLNAAFDYLDSTVQRDCEDQFFVEKGTLIHKEMMGGSESMIGFTAFCANAAIEYRATLSDSSTIAEVDDLLARASVWLRSKKTALLAKKNPFQMAITSYTLAKSSSSFSDINSQVARELVEGLESVAAQQGDVVVTPGECMVNGAEYKTATSCRSNGDCSSSEECCRVACSSDRKCKYKRNQYSYRRSGPSQIETDGYTLMAYLALYSLPGTPDSEKEDYRTKATAIQEALLEMRDDNGFFSSTQDTAVAMDSLSMFASTFQDTTGADFGVYARSGSQVSKPIIIKGNNYTVYGNEMLDVTGPPDDVSVMVEGTRGTAYATLLAKYNLAETHRKKTIDIVILPKRVRGVKVIHQCVKAKSGGSGTVGPMVVVSTNLQSGAEYTKLDGGNNANLSPMKVEYDEKNGVVTTYYMNDNDDDFMTERCVYIYYTQVYVVKERADGVAVAYDYYEPANNAEARYTVDVDDIEVECSGDDCPTIGAMGVHSSWFLLIITGLTILAIKMF